MFYYFARALAIVVVRILFKVKFEGTENIKDNSGCILCSNHRSLWDPIFIGIGIKKRKVSFMAKKELFSFPPFAYIMRCLGAFPVNRGRGDTDALKNAVNEVKSGKILLIFIEGTRSKTGKPMRAKSGAAHIAAQTEADIVPVSIFFEGKKISLRKRITVRFGESVMPQALGINRDSKPAELKSGSDNIMKIITGMLESEQKRIK